MYLFVFALAIFFVPTVVVVMRSHRNTVAIVVLDLACLAPTLINGVNVADPQHPYPTGMMEEAILIVGWLVALVWSFVSQPREEKESGPASGFDC